MSRKLLWSRLLRQTNTTRLARRNKAIGIAVESLEGRTLMAANITASLQPDGLLRIEGTPAADVIDLRQDANQLTVRGINIGTAVGSIGQVDANTVKRIEVYGLDGNDVIRLDQGSQAIKIDALLDGGSGNDTLAGGDGLNTFSIVTTEGDAAFKFKPTDRLLLGEIQHFTKLSINLAAQQVTTTGGNYRRTVSLGNGRFVALATDGNLWAFDGTTLKLAASSVQTLLQSRNGAGLPVATILHNGQLKQSFDGLSYSVIDLGGTQTALVEVRDSAGRQVLLSLRNDGVLTRLDSAGATYKSSVQALLQSQNGAGLPVATIIQNGRLQQSFNGLAYSVIDLGGAQTALAEVRDAAGRQVILSLRHDGILWRLAAEGTTYKTGIKSLVQSQNGSGLPVATILRDGRLEQSFDGLSYSAVDLGGTISSFVICKDSTGREIVYALRSDGVLWRIDSLGSQVAATSVLEMSQATDGSLHYATLNTTGWGTLPASSFAAAVPIGKQLGFDPFSKSVFLFDPLQYAQDGFRYQDIKQGQAGNCTFCAALASAASQGLPLGSMIQYLGGNKYRVYLKENGPQDVEFDGKIYLTDLQPNFQRSSSDKVNVDSLGRKSATNYWPIIFNRAYMQSKGVNWRTDDKNALPEGFLIFRAAWQSPKNANYALAGGDKNNWDTSEGSRTINHLLNNLRLGSVVTVSTLDRNYGGDPNSTLNWLDRSFGVGHEWAILGMRSDSTAAGGWRVRLYNPWGIELELSWNDFARSFDTIVMVSRAGIRY